MRNHAALVWLALGAMGGMTYSVSAATDPPAENRVPSDGGAQQPDSDNVLREIVVTATRRPEGLSKVPISIVALDRAALETSGIKSVADMAALVPGIEFDTAAGFGPNTLTNIAVRGINSNIGTSTTGIYLDDVPVQTRIVALSYWGNPFPLLFDVDRVEVDRGPQGTLFGAGAEGGAIRMISPDPGYSAYTGFVRSELASTTGGALSYEGGAAVGGPIIQDKLGFRVSAWGRRDGGYVDRIDPLTGTTLDPNSNSTNSYVVRGALGFKPVEGVTVTPSVFGQSVANADSNAYFEYLSNPAANRFENGRLMAQPAKEKFYLPSMKVEVALSDLTVTSISAYFHREGSLTQDGTSYLGAVLSSYLTYGNPLGPEFPASYDDAAPFYLRTAVNFITQEIRAASNDANAPLRWTAGLFFSRSTQTDTETVTSPFYMTNVFGLAPTSPLLFSQITSRDSQIALFGQADYRIIQALTLTVGARIARNVAKYEQDQSGPSASSEFPHASGKESQTSFIPKVSLGYQLTDSELLYASASKGYRPGGANQPIPLASDPGGCPLAAEPPPYSSDSLWSYELGSKSRVLGGRVALDVSAFFVSWSKIQQQIYFNSCSFGFIANTGNATSKGFDLATKVVLTEGLTAGLSAAYTDARVTRTVAFDGSVLVQTGDAVGMPPGVDSPWNLTGTIEYTLPVGNDNLSARLEDSYRTRNPGPFNSQISGTPLYAPVIPANPAYDVLNARLGWHHSDSDVALFVNNVTDRHPALYRYQDSVFSSLFTDTTLRPRTFGVTVSHTF